MMASITDCVTEGLKYPFKDIKKVICLGVFFAVINLLSVARGVTSLDIVRSIAKTDGANVISKIPVGDIYIMAFLSIIGIIITLFIMGYLYNVVKFSIDKKDELPGFGDIIGMFKNGIKYFIVTLAYAIVPTIVLVAGVFLTANHMYGEVVIFISIILFIIAYLLQIMAVNNIVANDKLSSAFAFGEITDKISNLGWAKYIGTILFTVLIFAIVMIAAGFILSVITVIFANLINNQAIVVSVVIGAIEGLLVTSYGAVFFNRVLGSVYREAIK